MRLFDEIITDAESLLQNKKRLDITYPWAPGSQNQMIFGSDAAFEIGGEEPSIGGILYTSDHLDMDQAYIIGPDINEITKDTPYARITILDVDDASLGTGNQLYQSLRKMDYARYHIYPKDAMIRISSMNKKESILIGKKAGDSSFGSLAKTFMEEYHKVKGVCHVMMVFITDKDFDYKSLEGLFAKAEGITRALDHLANKVNMDCHSCGLKVVCDEVQKMVKEDFKEEA